MFQVTPYAYALAWYVGLSEVFWICSIELSILLLGGGSEFVCCPFLYLQNEAIFYLGSVSVVNET